MAESFGLDWRIAAYRGTRAIGLYRSDLDCLEDVTALALKDSEVYPKLSGPGYEAMRTLHQRLRQLREKAYAEINRDRTNERE